MASTGTNVRSSGRPRDPTVEGRVRDAALEVYAERGYTGASIETIASRAKVGKAAVYLRWATKDDLLLDALSVASPHIRADPDLELRDLLLDLGRQMLSRYTGRYGAAAVRMAIEAPQLPEIFEPLEEAYAAELRVGVAAVDRAVARGELTLGVSAATVIETLGGALLMRAFFTARMEEDGMQKDGDRFVAEVVDLLVDGRLTEVAAHRSRTS